MNAQDRADFITQAVMNMIQGNLSKINWARQNYDEEARAVYLFAASLWKEELLLRKETEERQEFEQTHCPTCESKLKEDYDPVSGVLTGTLYCALCNPK